MRSGAVVLLVLGLVGCSAPPSPVATAADLAPDGGGQLWVPEGPLQYHACVESARTLLSERTADQHRQFERCVGDVPWLARLFCKGETAVYGDTLRPVRFGDLGGCVTSWTVKLSRWCCEDALACTLPATASP